MVPRLKRLPTKWEKNLCQLYIDKGLITRIYRKLKKKKKEKKKN
jgi:hypothetical protein